MSKPPVFRSKHHQSSDHQITSFNFYRKKDFLNLVMCKERKRSKISQGCQEPKVLLVTKVGMQKRLRPEGRRENIPVDANVTPEILLEGRVLKI